MSIAVLVLAAGSASRMGVAKQLLPFGDETLLETVLNNALTSKTQKVYCVLGAYAEKIADSIEAMNVETIINEDWKDGLGSSIARGVSHIVETTNTTEGILILLADQPFVDTGYINNMIETFKSDPSQIIASRYKKGNGVPALFPATLFSKLKALKGERGAKSLLNDTSQNIISLEPTISLEDIDTPEAYAHLLKKRDD